MIAHIEESIKKHIASANLPYLRFVASYAGQFDAGIEDIIRLYPAIWVTLKEEKEPKPTGTGRSVWHVPATFFVMVASRSLQNEASARQGGIYIGTYQMLADIRQLLLQQDFTLPIEPLRPGKTLPLYSKRLRDEGMSIFAQEWHTLYPIEFSQTGAVHRYPELVHPASFTDNDEKNAKNICNLNGTSIPPPDPLPDFLRIGMNYYLRPPKKTHEEPDIADHITLTHKETA